MTGALGCLIGASATFATAPCPAVNILSCQKFPDIGGIIWGSATFVFMRKRFPGIGGGATFGGFHRGRSTLIGRQPIAILRCNLTNPVFLGRSKNES